MNVRYKDNMLQLLAFLEQAKRLTFPQLISRFEIELSERTLQRYVKEFESSFALPLTQAGRGLLSLPEKDYAVGVARFLKAYLTERVNPPIYGAVTEKLLTEAMEFHSRPATVFSTLLTAICDSRCLQFAYKPQHPETRKKRRAQKVRQASSIAPEGYYPVSMVPCGFSFSGELLLVVGEAILPDGARAHRQYAVRGMLNPQCGAPTHTQLEFDFSKLYADSVYTWIGGKNYSLTIEDARFDETPQEYALNANGEEEILRFAASALGRVKIVNPPRPLVEKAKELHLDQRQLFRFRA